VQPEDQTIADPAEARRLIDEAAFAMTAREWPGNQYDADWAMQHTRPFLEDPVLIDAKKARHALDEADRTLKETEPIARSANFRRARLVLEPVVDVLPDERAYAEAVAHITDELRVAALKSGYYKASEERGDHWAWN
jgi:hypothetical protein